MTTQKITANQFKELIFNYETASEWRYQGEKPAIVDFYAEWCGPCKAIAPVLEELAAEHENDIVIYKIDTDQEAELSALFSIQSIPTLLFIPMEGQPMMQKGALPKHILEQVINERLVKKNMDQS